MKAAAAIMLMTMVVFTGCHKENNGENGGENGGSDPTTEGIYLGVIGFNSQLYVKDISLLNSSTKSSFTNFIDGLTSGNGTGLYYADYTALKKMNAYTKPPKLKNVALVTFTDGLDNVSIATSETDPENYGSTSAYREALHNKIVNEKIHGLNVAAYTIGLKGNDVTDEAQFNETLKKLASNDNNVFQVANMNEAMQRLSEIAENLYSVSTTVNLGVDVPGGYDDGQMLRFTFDNVNAATASTRYIEARYRRNGNSRILDNIAYVGFAQGQSSISSSSVQGVYYHFQFSDLTYTNGNSVSQADINRIKLWKQTSNGGWDKETEFDPASSSTVTEDKSSALIMLVLDCTNSLGSSDFNKMQQGGKNFVKMLVSSNSGSGSGGGGNTNWGYAPEGGINGLFSVSGSSQVYFSKGNLQYQASTGTWRFAESQLDYIGSANSNISSSYSGWIDLFGWGTGNNPTNSSESSSSNSSFTDWGSKPISNGGNLANQWRTLTSYEWSFLMFNRSTSSGIRYAKATVNGVNGVIILPDDWSTSYYTLSSTNSTSASFSANTITFSNWTSKFEAHGAVFLPAAGNRGGTSVYYVGTYGGYWSSTPYGSVNASYLNFNGSGLGTDDGNCVRGRSVRLVAEE